MSGIQAPEGATAYTLSDLRKRSLQITRTFGPFLSTCPRDPYSDPRESKFKSFPVIESYSQGKKIYRKGIRIPLSNKEYKFLEISLSQDEFEMKTGHRSLLLRLVPWEKEDGFADMPRLCSRDSYSLDELELNVSMTHGDIWADFSPLCIDRKGTYDLVKRYLDNPDTHSLGYELKGALLKLGLVNLLYLR